jgi:hypothetical protein
MLARAAWLLGVIGIIVVNLRRVAIIISNLDFRSKETPYDKLDKAHVCAVGVDQLIILGVSSDSSEL